MFLNIFFLSSSCAVWNVGLIPWSGIKYALLSLEANRAFTAGPSEKCPSHVAIKHYPVHTLLLYHCRCPIYWSFFHPIYLVQLSTTTKKLQAIIKGQKKKKDTVIWRESKHAIQTHVPGILELSDHAFKMTVINMLRSPRKK